MKITNKIFILKKISCINDLLRKGNPYINYSKNFKNENLLLIKKKKVIKILLIKVSMMIMIMMMIIFKTFDSFKFLLLFPFNFWTTFKNIFNKKGK
jgi:hypothetical protein